MKVGILTFPNSPSYGASLQMFALYKTIMSLDVDVEIINYRNTYMTTKRHIKKESNIVKRVVLFVLDLPSRFKFRRFERKMIFFPERIISEKENLSVIAERYDYLLCGSDQVWNPLVTGYDLNYFLKFCLEDRKKISYAASFGVEKIEDNYAQEVKSQLNCFKNISVREERGVRIVQELLGHACDIVLDPTMLLVRDEWKNQEKKVKGLPNKYIAKFIFNYDTTVEAKIKQLSVDEGLPIVTIGGTVLSKLREGYYTGPIGPREWLYVLDNAEYVVTDSFHGAAFSIIFEKQFFVSLASSTNSRLKTLINTFGLQDRCVYHLNTNVPIDYVPVNKIMQERKKHSINYLKTSLHIAD